MSTNGKIKIFGTKNLCWEYVNIQVTLTLWLEAKRPSTETLSSLNTVNPKNPSIEIVIPSFMIVHE